MQTYTQDSGLEIIKRDPVNARLVARTPEAIENMNSLHEKWLAEQPDGVNMSQMG